MDGFSVLCLLLAGGGVLFGLIQRLRARRQLAQMDRMLDRALEGQFQETTFDESAPSALEAKLARFLNGSAASARGLAEERGKIAALIADISHQTKTPIAALLLYSSLLAEHRGQTLTREQLLDRVWDGGEFVDENALSVAVNRLRRKLGEAPIRTVYGVGYVWAEG